jgi:hypothetical protein
MLVCQVDEKEKKKKRREKGNLEPKKKIIELIITFVTPYRLHKKLLLEIYTHNSIEQ